MKAISVIPQTRLEIVNPDDRPLSISWLYAEVIKWKASSSDAEKNNHQEIRKATAEEVPGGSPNSGDITQTYDSPGAKNWLPTPPISPHSKVQRDTVVPFKMECGITH